MSAAVDNERHRSASVLRTLGAIVALLLGVLAVALAIFGSTTRDVQLGMLIGLWAALIGVFAAVTGRHNYYDTVAGSEVELRRDGDVELASVAAERREFQQQLEVMLRREMERVLRNEVGALRDEIAALRGEVLDQLGGQLRLERIETTRLIGSDLEALQNEVRRLAELRDARTSVFPAIASYLPQNAITEAPRTPVPAAPLFSPAAVPPAAPAPVAVPAANLTSPLPYVPPTPPPAVPPEPAPAVPVTSAVPMTPAAEVAPAAPAPPSVSAQPTPAPAAVPRSSPSAYPFPDLPSLSPFTPYPEPTSVTTQTAAPAAVTPPASPQPAAPAPSVPAAPSPEAPAATANAATATPPPRPGPPPSGYHGRRRAAEAQADEQARRTQRPAQEAEDEQLARMLGR
jgi:hypothetical protein